MPITPGYRVPDCSQYTESPEGPNGSEDPQHTEDSGIEHTNVLDYQGDEEIHKAGQHNDKIWYRVINRCGFTEKLDHILQ